MAALDEKALKSACYDYAKAVYWEQRPTDVAEIQAFADLIFNKAVSHVETLVENDRDPDFLVGCIRYLERAHAIPPLRGNSQFVGHAIEVLVELACPSSVFDVTHAEFLNQVLVGIRSTELEAQSK